MTFEFGPNQTRWLETLETTDQPQAQGYLSCTHGMCCLGVAAVGVFDAERHEEKRNEDFWIERFPEADDGAGTELEEHFAKSRLGLRNGVGGYEKRKILENEPQEVYDLCCLAELNDNGWTFKQIAAFIRRNPEAVFTHAA